MIHLNGNLLCVIDSETTGLDPFNHCMWQFTCLPLDFRLDVHKEIGVFDIKLQPTSTLYDPKAVGYGRFSDAMMYGLPSEIGCNLFHEWFERLPLGFKKRICVLAHNWPFDREFVKAWLGPESFEYYFDPRYRDTMALAAGVCDACDRHGDQVPFTSLALRRVAKELQIEWDDRLAHNSLYDAHQTALVYKELLKRIGFIL